MQTKSCFLVALCVVVAFLGVARAEWLLGTTDNGGVLTLDTLTGKVNHISSGYGWFLNAQSKSAVDVHRGIVWHIGSDLRNGGK